MCSRVEAQPGVFRGPGAPDSIWSLTSSRARLSSMVGVPLFQKLTVKVGSDRPGTQPGPRARESEPGAPGQWPVGFL